ncbi:MAG TPA: flagellar hook-associated protein FlgK [Phycisphaerales bacterium]|nr:flagellar hook-associated protein FlgK [Phycisphaerales bacterium]
MSINSGFSIARTGLLSSQVGLQVAGNNISNANSVGFTRQRLDLSPLADQRYGNLRLGTGVNTLGIRRMTDRALQQRSWNAASTSAAADTAQQQLESLENLLGSLNDSDTTSGELDGPNISTAMTSFFSAWSSLSQAPNDAARRQLVISQGESLADYFHNTRASIVSQQGTIDTDLNASIERANSLLSQIAEVNGQILTGGGASASGLLDRRDQLVGELSTLCEVTVNEQPSGSADILIGSTPLVNGALWSPMTLRTRVEGGQTVTEVVAGENNDSLAITSGRIGALLSAKQTGYQSIINKIDALASQIIYQTNRAYSRGSAAVARSSYSADRAVINPNLAFNDPANSTFSPLAFAPGSGQIVVEVVTGTGSTASRQRTTIPIDLDGINSANTAGYADDTSPADIAAALNAVPNLTATIDVDGRLQVTAAAGSTVSFVDDTSGALAAMGINCYFTGSNAQDMGVSADLADNSLLNVTTLDGTTPNASGIAMAVVALRDQTNSDLGEATFSGYWDAATQTVSASASNAKTQSQAAGAVKDSLDSQVYALTGVNLDEEAINLVQFQTMYSASARYVGVLQEVTQTLLGMI